MHGENWACGAMTTTTSGRTHRLATKHPLKRAERLSNLRAPRPARLPNPKPTTINTKHSRYERGTTGGQVKGYWASCLRDEGLGRRDLPGACLVTSTDGDGIYNARCLEDQGYRRNHH